MSARAVILVGNKVDLVRSRLVSTEGTAFFFFFSVPTPIIDVSLATSFVGMVYEDTREWKFLRILNREESIYH